MIRRQSIEWGLYCGSKSGRVPLLAMVKLQAMLPATRGFRKEPLQPGGFLMSHTLWIKIFWSRGGHRTGQSLTSLYVFTIILRQQQQQQQTKNLPLSGQPIILDNFPYLIAFSSCFHFHLFFILGHPFGEATPVLVILLD